MSIDTLTNLIANVGFPIAIALYVLLRLEKTLAMNTSAINHLTLQLNSIKHI